MNYTIITSRLAALALIGCSIAQAGTAGITGQYSGMYSVFLYNGASRVLLGSGAANPNNAWRFDFDAGVFNISPGFLNVGFPYVIGAGATLEDNGDGTYTGTYDLKIGAKAKVQTTIWWDIALSDGTITVTTLDPEDDGVMGAGINGVLPVTVSPVFDGTANPAPNISVNTEQLDFGLVTAGDVSIEHITLSNNGAEDLILGAVSGADTFADLFIIVSDTCSGSVLESTQSCALSIQFQPRTAGIFTGSLVIPSNDPDTPQLAVSVAGKGMLAVAEISVSTTTLEFGDVALGTSRTGTITVTNQGGAALTVHTLGLFGANAGEFAQQHDCGSLAAGTSCVISITFMPQTKANKSAALIVKSDDPVTKFIPIYFSGAGADLVSSITGTYAGQYSVTLYNAAIGTMLGKGVAEYPWRFDFDQGVFQLGSGRLTTGLPFSTGGALTLVDHLDGRYTGSYDLTVATAAQGGGTGTTSIQWKIEKVGDALKITTLDADANGVPGTTIAGVLSLPVSVVMEGAAVVADADSDGDGVTDAVEKVLGLNPNHADLDGDGDSDALEVGTDVEQPLDSDGDGLIDAMEFGTFAVIARIAHGLPLPGGETVTITTDAGDALTRVRSAAVTAAEALPQVVFPFGVISYASTSPVGGSATIKFSFSAELPEKLVLYKVSKANTYLRVPEDRWSKLDARTVQLSLTDGDSTTDLDALNNGVIEDSVAIGNDVVRGFDFTGGGGCSIRPFSIHRFGRGDEWLLLLFAVWFVRMLVIRRCIARCSSI